jgi:hypothetical protein
MERCLPLLALVAHTVEDTVETTTHVLLVLEQHQDTAIARKLGPELLECLGAVEVRPRRPSLVARLYIHL